MGRTLTIIVIAITALGNAPRARASLARLLCEVNPEWHARPELRDSALARPYFYRDDYDIVAKHLELVERALRRRDVAQWPLALRAARERRLADLHAYRQARRFPRNEISDHRTPIFVDGHGNICAVGYLLVLSGMGAFAEQVHRNDNLVHIRQIHDARFRRWADTSGLTIDELAWIQPGYSQDVPWYAVGLDSISKINCLVIDTARGLLYAAGEHVSIGGDTTYGSIAAWDGHAWSHLAHGVGGPIVSASMYAGRLYVAGRFNYYSGGVAIRNVTCWDGSAWLPVRGGVLGTIHAFAVFHDTLFAGGDLTWADGVTVHSIAAWDGSAWTRALGDFDAPIYSLASIADTLYAGGAFTHVGNVDAAHVARRVDGAWDAVGAGLNAPVATMMAFGSQLFAGGDFFTASGDSLFGLATWSDTAWTDYRKYGSSVHANSIGYESLLPRIVSFGTLQGVAQWMAPTPMVALAFTDSSGRTHTEIDPAYVFDLGIYTNFFPRRWDSVVTAMMSFNNKFYLGGGMDSGLYFTTFLASGVREEAPFPVECPIAPQPVREEFQVRLSDVRGPKELRVYDCVGREILRWNGDDNAKDISARGWGAGLYIYSIRQRGLIVSRGKFVVE